STRRPRSSSTTSTTSRRPPAGATRRTATPSSPPKNDARGREAHGKARRCQDKRRRASERMRDRLHRLHLVVAVVLLAGGWAGCLGNGHDTTINVAGGVGAAVGLPPGCDRTRVAVAHHANATAAFYAGPRPIGCFVHTGADSSEPSI